MKVRTMGIVTWVYWRYYYPDTHREIIKQIRYTGELDGLHQNLDYIRIWAAREYES